MNIYRDKVDVKVLKCFRTTKKRVKMEQRRNYSFAYTRVALFLITHRLAFNLHIDLGYKGRSLSKINKRKKYGKLIKFNRFLVSSLLASRSVVLIV